MALEDNCEALTSLRHFYINIYKKRTSYFTKAKTSKIYSVLSDIPHYTLGGM